MKRLILFSGGVESTALLTIKQETDVVITIEDTSPGETPTFNRQAVLNIAHAFNTEVQFCTIFTPYERPKTMDTKYWVYQLWPFLAVASAWCAKDPSITELWYGGEYGGVDLLYDPWKKYVQLHDGWNIMHPTVPIVFPLEAYTKEQHWELIPDHVKPLVRTCILNVHPEKDENCGKCRKCLELKMLRGSCLYQG